MFKELYQSIAKRIEDAGFTVDYYVGQYLGQPGQQYTNVDTVFIEFQRLNFQQLRDNVQQGVFAMNVHFVQDCKLDSSERIVDQALAHYEKVQSLYHVLHETDYLLSDIQPSVANTSDDMYLLTGLRRTRIQPDNTLSGLFVTIQQFEGLHRDSSKQLAVQAAQQSASVSVRINTKIS